MRNALIIGFALGLAACLPSLNWREVHPPGASAVLLFPCKPVFDERPAAAGQGAMGLAQCEAGPASYSLSWADVGEPARVGGALRAMTEAMAAKLKAPLPRGEVLVVAGMTPQPEAVQHRFQTPGVNARSAVFAHGATVYQLLRVSPDDDLNAWDNFVASLRVGSAVQTGR